MMTLLSRLLRRVSISGSTSPNDGLGNVAKPEVPVAPLTETTGDGLKPLYTLVPGAQPIELIDYYPSFADYYPECELQTKRWFVENVEKDWVIFDVGANIGYYSILFSRLAPSGRVFAFEPTETIKKFNANVAFHGCKNIVAFERALGAVAGAIEEDVYRIWGQPPERMTYNFSTIDTMVRELNLTRLDCLKIDVDSFDFEVLRGAEETLAKLDPWVVVELNHALARRNHSAPEAFQWLAARGYNSAFVLDHENFVLRRMAQAQGTGLPKLGLNFDTRPLFLEPAYEKANERPNPFATEPHVHDNSNKENDAGRLQIAAKGPRWSYVAEWPLVNEVQDSFLMEVEVEVEGGDIAFSFLGPDRATILGETTVHVGGFRQSVTLYKPETAAVGSLLLRNVDTNGAVARTRVFQMRCFDAVPAKPAAPSRALQPSVSRISAKEIVESLEPKIELSQGGDTIDVVAVEKLGESLGAARPFIPTALYRHGLSDFKTERDETPIFEYIYSNFAPRRHLEIGTWEGHGATTVARVCDAEIWTVNLPEGERDEQGAPKYAGLPGELASLASDTAANVGWRYREAGFGPRVHQIFCNSLDLNYGQWSPGFFDTVFIDGGHTREVVTSDTENTLPRLRSGGLMIWHDFCPDPLTLSQNEAPRGVVAAVAANLAGWRPQFSKMFWIRPSWILIGIKR